VQVTVEENKNVNWLVTNRAHENGSLITIVPNGKEGYFSYFWDYLFLKKVRGDATHTIRASLLGKIRFAKTIRQAEEWLFFYELSLAATPYYKNVDSTLSEGYDTDGLNDRKRTTKEELQNIKLFLREGIARNIIWRPTFDLYVMARLVKALIS
jgi:hypothetical protein